MAQNSVLRQQVGQKIMLDLRYFCPQTPKHGRCVTPVTQLPDALERMLVQGNIGGVILFAENLNGVRQIVELNYRLQQVMQQNGLPPLLIAIDQEGGRVARLPDSVSTRFVGNMAIGATYPKHGKNFAQAVGAGIGSYLKLLGFNLNFAPTVDVNVNPQNPVINVRSFGESPRLVAQLGVEMVAAMQQAGVISAAKHFPGHGDTAVDSHTGLPLVEHPKRVIDQVDLYPFAQLINSATPPGMIMTAHIQYPALDATQFTGKDGASHTLPATLSRAILTDLLRKQMKYKGVVVTDALDMAGIANFLKPEDALIATFAAGADIALMPVAVRTPQDIPKVYAMQQAVMDAVADGRLVASEIALSARRIAQLKTDYQLARFTRQPLAHRIQQAEAKLPSTANQQLERALANASITKLKGLSTPYTRKRTLFVMPDTARCEAFKQVFAAELATSDSRCISLARSPLPAQPSLAGFERVVIGELSPGLSVVEMGGMEDLEQLKRRADVNSQQQWQLTLLQAAAEQSLERVVVLLRAPYSATQFLAHSDTTLATYGYNVKVSADGSVGGSVYQAVADVLTGKIKATGSLPVTVQGVSREQ